MPANKKSSASGRAWKRIRNFIVKTFVLIFLVVLSAALVLTGFIRLMILLFS